MVEAEKGVCFMFSDWFKGVEIDKSAATSAIAGGATDAIIDFFKNLPLVGTAISLVQGIWNFTKTFGIKSPELEKVGKVASGEEQLKAQMQPHAEKLAAALVGKAEATLAGKAAGGEHVAANKPPTTGIPGKPAAGAGAPGLPTT